MREIETLPRHAAQTRKVRVSVVLPSLLYKAFYNNVRVNETTSYTVKLKRKFQHLEKQFAATFPELKKLQQTAEQLKKEEELTPVPPEKFNEISNQYTERFVVRFIEMIEWCKVNDKWAVNSINQFTSPQAILNYLNSITTQGGLSLTHTREDRLAELRKLAEKQTKNLT